MVSKTALLVEVISKLRVGSTITREQLEGFAREICAKSKLDVKYQGTSIFDYEIWQGTMHNDSIIENSQAIKGAIELKGNYIIVKAKASLTGHGIKK